MIILLTPLWFSVGSLSTKKLRSALFEQTPVFAVGQAQIKITSKLTSLLQVSCFGSHKAFLLLATIHLSDLGDSVNHKLVESMPSLLLHCYFIAYTVIFLMMIYNIDPCVFQGHIYSIVWLVCRVMTAMHWYMQGTSIHKELMVFQKTWTWLIATTLMLGHRAVLTVPRYIKIRYVHS